MVVSLVVFGSEGDVFGAVDIAEVVARLLKDAEGGGKRAKNRRSRGGRDCASLRYSCEAIAFLQTAQSCRA